MAKFALLIFFLVLHWQNHAQDKTSAGNRPSSYSGSFYSADPKALKRDLEFLFSRALPKKQGSNPLAIIAPHAGYPYSGEVAATAYKQVDPKKKYENIFIIGSSHRFAFKGAAIYTAGNFETPFGEVRVNLGLGNELTKNNKVFLDYNAVHINEHSLEVQLPFLQYYLQKDFHIVPILLGTQSQSHCKQIADALQPYLNGNNLFVISADFSHYPEYRAANMVDLATANAICSNDPQALITTLTLNEEKNIPNLATSACAWPSILTLMYMTQEGKENMEYELVRYQNSGDTRKGDKNRVVGYCAITVRKKDFTRISSFMLNEEEKKDLLEIARTTLDSYITEGKIQRFNSQNFSPTLSTHTGAFVTLHKDGKLRGCIGRFQSEKPLYEVVRDMAISASTKDYRFKPVQPGELDQIELEISVLTPLQPVSDASEIQLGRHGVYIKKGQQSGTFLPQVATQTGWNIEEFLGHCAHEKARIGWYGWKDAELFVYEALVFTEAEFKHE